ncbi:hypothetical protein [Psychromarinibacter halotolerans]|uniref:CBM1 domain-containing protein n=1 Tax=Psychromarinibacter halotolerans TaxID=1775175 RepID=A0ABV7GSG4_9RHOB|nr:hypothetical protein [Psychromarinibacter halotolerans]MDF0597515.1 hypothetical protein [Psychromarinibacter halotolerans]
MKTFATLVLAAALLAPTIAAAEYICPRMWDKKYGGTCPQGSVWSEHYLACIKA